MRLVPVPPHVHSRWIVSHREGCCSGSADGSCDCWPTAQCAECEAMIDVGEWSWEQIRAGAVVDFVGASHG